MKNVALNTKIIIYIVLAISILFYIFSKILSNDSINAIEKTAKVIRETKKIHNFAKQLNEISKSKDKTIETTSNDKNNNIDSSEYYKYYTKSQLSEMKKYCLWRNKKLEPGKIEYHAIDQAVNKWHGKITFDDFMNTVKNGTEVKFRGSIYKVTKKCTAPCGFNNEYKAATIYWTDKTFLKEIFNEYPELINVIK